MFSNTPIRLLQLKTCILPRCLPVFSLGVYCRIEAGQTTVERHPVCFNRRLYSLPLSISAIERRSESEAQLQKQKKTKKKKLCAYVVP